MTVCGTTAQYPGAGYLTAVQRIARGVTEPVFGAISSAHIQLCPQSVGNLSEAAVEGLRDSYPKTQFRTHANARVLPKLVMGDLSNVSAETLPYFDALGDRNRRLGATVVSLHAGYRDRCSLEQMLDNRALLEDRLRIQICVEGLYPNKRRAQLVSTWCEYERLLTAGIPLAIDLSHLNIVAGAERTCEKPLVMALCEAALEIHVSDNDAMADAHAVPAAEPWWTDILHLACLRDECVIFTEGRQQ